MVERQKYSREFKLEAVRLLEAGQKPAAELGHGDLPAFFGPRIIGEQPG